MANAPAFPVSILQGKPLPAQATVLVNGKVTRRNRDRASRRVRSDTNAWPAFTLRPGRSKTVTLRRRGFFRYKVDGRACGAVAVATTCGGGGGGGGGSTKTVVYHYDVALVGHVKETQVTTGEPPASELNGTLSLALDWTGTFTNVAVKKLTVGNQWIVGMNTGLFASGTMTGTHVFSDSRGRFGGPCQGQVAIPSSEARFFVGGQHFPTSPLSEFHLAAQMLLEPGTAMANRIATRPGDSGSRSRSFRTGKAS